jgi:hypothetical protein
MLLIPALLSVVCLSNLASVDDGKSADQPRTKITFNEHIAPIIYQNCTTCHRSGEGAPFALEGYGDVKRRASMIALVTEERVMPPWLPVEGHGVFDGSRRMLESEIQLIQQWIEDGRLEGPKAKAPAQPKFASGWQLGEPDLVLSMQVPFDVPAEGADIYRNFVLPKKFTEDRWVTAVEVRASAPDVLHHSLFDLADAGEVSALDARDKAPGFGSMGFRRTGSLGGWAVGTTAKHLPQELAYLWRKGSNLVLASHFHPSGVAREETLTVGIHFADQAPKRTLTSLQIPPNYGQGAGLLIPAGEEDYRFKGSFVLPVDVELVTAGGHAHTLCKSMDATATLPDGSTQPLFRIDAWDFKWQGIYSYAKPVFLPKGTRIDGWLSYDNTANNPSNPHSPPRTVGWGLETNDEMGSLIFELLAANEEDLLLLNAALQIDLIGARAMQRVLAWTESVEVDDDGSIVMSTLSRREAGAAQLLDLDNDSIVSADEIGVFYAVLEDLESIR